MKIGTLVIWTKTDPRDDRPESVKQFPAYVNELWPDDAVSLWVLSPDGQCVVRCARPNEYSVIADPDQLVNLLTVVPNLLQKFASDIQELKEIPMTQQAVIESEQLRQQIAKVNDAWTEAVKTQSDRILALEQIIGHWTNTKSEVPQEAKRKS